MTSQIGSDACPPGSLAAARSWRLVTFMSAMLTYFRFYCYLKARSHERIVPGGLVLPAYVEPVLEARSDGWAKHYWVFGLDAKAVINRILRGRIAVDPRPEEGM